MENAGVRVRGCVVSVKSEQRGARVESEGG